MFRLFRFLENNKFESICAPFFKMTEACFELAVPIVMAKIIDVGIKNHDKAYIYKMGIILVLLGFLGLCCSLTAQYFAAKASLSFGTSLRTQLFKHINTFSYSEIDNIGSHTLVTRMTADINTVQTGVNMLLRLILRSPFIVIGSVVMAFTISVKLTLVFLIISPCLALVIYAVMRLTVPKYKNIQKTLDSTNRMTEENLEGARVIRAFSRQKNEADDFHENTDNLRNQQIIAGRISALTNPATYVIVNIALIAIIWFGGKSVNLGEITQGQVIALVNYMNQILMALLAFALLVTSVVKMQASAVRVNDIFDINTTISDGEGVAENADECKSCIEFCDCSFSYRGSDKKVLEDISLSVGHGETVGIIGGTGSGKTSLVNLIPRFYDISEGSVKIDGHDVRDYKLKALRKKIGIVPQKAVLFKGTVRDNMRWRKSNADDKEINSALEIAQALDFVQEKPQKLDTMLVEDGKNLSGGQRQRLTIARALVGNPEILIMDDSSSALDLATDAKLRKSLSGLSGKMTVIIVSQRISSIKNADKIVVLDDGKVAGMGTHSQLFESCEVYKEICLSQLSEKEVQSNGR